MSGKRRDNKGRILHTGESQRKNGMYIKTYKEVKMHDKGNFFVPRQDLLFRIKSLKSS